MLNIKLNKDEKKATKRVVNSFLAFDDYQRKKRNLTPDDKYKTRLNIKEKIKNNSFGLNRKEARQFIFMFNKHADGLDYLPQKELKKVFNDPRFKPEKKVYQKVVTQYKKEYKGGLERSIYYNDEYIKRKLNKKKVPF